MTALWIAPILAGLIVAWRRYGKVVTESAPGNTSDTTLSQPHPPQPWGTHHHQQGARRLHELFERSARRFPHLPALSVPEQGDTLTYAELDEQADTLAATLESLVTGPEPVIAVCLNQDNSLPVILHLAILKAGAAQCFIDAESPAQHLQRVLADVQPALFIAEQAIADKTASELDLPVLTPTALMDAAASHHSGKSVTSPQMIDEPSLASIFYISGTTGAPKGVECPHEGFINLAKSYAAFYDFVPGTDASTLTSSLGYDGSI